MPIPKPGDRESNESFMKRCMSDETMMSEYPKQEQRLAICTSQCERSKKSKKTIKKRIII